MPRHPIAKITAVLGLATACAAPSAAMGAGPGGFVYGDAPSGSLISSPGALLGGVLRVEGTFAGAPAGRPVTVQRQDADNSWAPAGAGVTAADGSFVARWRTDRAGPTRLRAVLADEAGASAAAAEGSLLSTGTVTVYRPGTATFFGPGLYGKRTACGQKLTPGLAGVANKSLPCGTLVDLYYHGHTVTVPVVDRGPFRAHTTWDLTTATADALGMRATARIGALRSAAPVPAPAPAPAPTPAG